MRCDEKVSRQDLFWLFDCLYCHDFFIWCQENKPTIPQLCFKIYHEFHDSNNFKVSFCILSFIADIGLDIQDDMGRHDVGYVENDKVEINHGKGCLFTSNFNIKKVKLFL